MDVRQLFQLAKDNSRIAEKKFERDSAKRGGIDSFDVSKDAITKYLAKREKQKEEKLAAEKLARQQRIQARLDANTNKKKLKQQQQERAHIEKLQAKEKELNNTKFKVHESHKLKTDKKDIKKPITNSQNDKSIIYKERENVISKTESKHRKEDARTLHKPNSIKQKSRIHQQVEQRGASSKKPVDSKKPISNGTAVNFLDLMKMAKTNSVKALHSDDPHNLNLKRHLPSNKKNNEEQFDPDRFVKTKVAKKEKHIQSQLSSSISKHNIDITKTPPVKSKPGFDKRIKKPETTQYTENRPKCSLIAETISTTSNGDNMKRMSKMYKQTKPSHNSNIGRFSHQNIPLKKTNNRGISAQNHGIPKKNLKGMKLKKSVRDAEDEFEREERELLRKRKLFEMRRVTGNKDLREEDLFIDDYDDDDDYDDEDDDFIDDSEDTVNASKYIREIFGYDRRRYDDSDDDDLADMEASYSQIQKEESRSARIAKIEDDYERMKEEEEEKRKKKRR